MAIQCIFTNDPISADYSWASDNQSDSWASVTADGGSITRRLGKTDNQTQSTVTYTSNGSSVNIHMGTWVTLSAPETFTIPMSASFGFNHACCWESAGQLNAHLYYKVSVVEEVSAGVIDFKQALTDWKYIEHAGAIEEMGTAQGSAFPMGASNTAGGINTYALSTSAVVNSGDFIAVEIGIETVGRNNDTVNFEFGSIANDWDDASLTTGAGTGPYGSEIIIPLNWSNDAYTDVWNDHSEIHIPWYDVEEAIAWSDVGTDWSAAKWTDTGAQRYVNRYGGDIDAQMWVFQDRNYLYFALNLIIDGCIQTSDHQRVFLCAGDDWRDSLETDPEDWQFSRDITAGGSDTRSPTLPVAQGDGNDAGEYVLQGLTSATYPENWEIPTYTAGTKTFSFTNGKTWQDGVDWRFKGPGATSTAPNPGGNPAGAYSELQIKQSSLNNWNGIDDLGVMVSLQCDVQGNGVTLFPPLLGIQIDKSDWPWMGIIYAPNDAATASSKISKDLLDLRSINAAHGHVVNYPDAVTSYPIFFSMNF
jgi:hypothetical protein